MKRSTMEEDDSGWEKPSESEMKVIQARRERSDKISSMMGEYLLKGYKMLSSTCNNCDTILLQDKRGNLYCVACEEIDCMESAKDEPALSVTAARRQAEESQFSGTEGSNQENGGEKAVPSTSRFPDTGTTQSVPSISKNRFAGSLTSSISNSHCLSSSSHLNSAEGATSPDCNYNSNSPEADQYLESDLMDLPAEDDDNTCRVEINVTPDRLDTHKLAIEEKMDWACKMLKSSKNVNKCIELSVLIKSCAESLVAIQMAERGYRAKIRKINTTGES